MTINQKVSTHRGDCQLSFSDGQDVAYVEAAEGLGRIVQPGVRVNRLALGFERIGSDALPAADSARMIRAVLETR